MYTPIIVTEENFAQAIQQNFQLILQECRYKFPVNGKVRLMGNIDLNSLYTIRGVTPTTSKRGAVSVQPYGR